MGAITSLKRLRELIIRGHPADKASERVQRILVKTLYTQPASLALGALTTVTAAFVAAWVANNSAMFIATGQDVANVAESHAGMTYGELLDNGDYYWSITLPSVICATYGGGTALPTQRECLEMMDCYGTGKADKLAEIIAAVVLAGDVSLSCAILANEWVSSHERLGRNR